MIAACTSDPTAVAGAAAWSVTAVCITVISCFYIWRKVK